MRKHGSEFHPLAKQTCSGEDYPGNDRDAGFALSGLLALLSPEIRGLLRRWPAPAELPRRGFYQPGPALHTQTPGATPHKDSRIRDLQGRVNEMPAASPGTADSGI